MYRALSDAYAGKTPAFRVGAICGVAGPFFVFLNCFPRLLLSGIEFATYVYAYYNFSGGGGICLSLMPAR